MDFLDPYMSNLWILVPSTIIVLGGMYWLAGKLDEAWNEFFREVTSSAEDKWYDNRNIRIQLLMESNMQEKLQKFKDSDPNHACEIRVQDPDNKVITISGQPVDYNQTIVVKVRNTQTGHYTLAGVDVFDPRWLDEEELVLGFENLIDELIYSQTSREYQEPAW